MTWLLVGDIGFAPYCLIQSSLTQWVHQYNIHNWVVERQILHESDVRVSWDRAFDWSKTLVARFGCAWSKHFGAPRSPVRPARNQSRSQLRNVWTPIGPRVPAWTSVAGTASTVTMQTSRGGKSHIFAAACCTQPGLFRTRLAVSVTCAIQLHRFSRAPRQDT